MTSSAYVSANRARKKHINFEHINFLKVGTGLGQPAGSPEDRGTPQVSKKQKNEYSKNIVVRNFPQKWQQTS